MHDPDHGPNPMGGGARPYGRPPFIRHEMVRQGVGFGSALAIAISFSTHKSILWAIVHGFFSWGYVVYYALTR